jgi:CO/xanthine dehydrogenase Mo-binding subunit
MLRHSNSGTALDRYWPFALADGEACHVGEAVALVLAHSRYLAEDAAALVEVDYDVLAAVADCRNAGDPRAPSGTRSVTQAAASTHASPGGLSGSRSQGPCTSHVPGPLPR